MRGIKGVILAAGEGRRLYPVTDEFPKPLVPIGNISILEHQINLLKSVNILDIIIVIGYYGFEITKELGDGEKYGVNIHYCFQKEPLGSANALLCVQKEIDDSFLLLLGDIYFEISNLKDVLNLFMEKKANGVLTTKIEPSEDIIKRNYSVILDSDDKVLNVIEKPQKIYNNLRGCGMYLFDTNIFDSINRTSRTALRNEYEITDAIKIFIDMGNSLYAVKINGDDTNITFPYELLLINIAFLKKRGLTNLIHHSAIVGEKCHFNNTLIGKNVKIGNNVSLENCVVFPYAIVKSNKIYANCIINKSSVVSLPVLV
jgi:NDP-sugar pyrophosphorylase family protein